MGGIGARGTLIYGIMSFVTKRDPERGAVDVLLGALAGSTLLPFVQAIANKSGEDVYAKIKHALSAHARKRVKAEIKDTGTVTLVFADTRIVLRMPARMTPAAAEQLAQFRLPIRRDRWLRISWDHAQSRWVALECDPPHDLPS